MNALLIVFSIPFFFGGIAIELWLARRRGRRLYDYADSMSDLSCGLGQQVTLALAKGALLAPYVLVWERGRAWTMPQTWWSWVVLLLVLDLAYYWAHRVSHRVNFVWAGHVVHHQSEEFNLAVALRQSMVQLLFEVPFYIPLALMGFEPGMFIAAKTIDTLYQFWIHTRLVGKLGPLEWVLNTPSHHRVHHGINPKYIDKNYAGMLIVWDRLFGTFTPEEEEPAYGTVKPLESWNPLWANVERWVGLARMAAATHRLRDKLLVWVMPPDWRPADLGGPVEIPRATRETQTFYRTPLRRGLAGYVSVNFALATLATGAIITASDRFEPAVRVLAVVMVLAALCGWAGLVEQRRWAVPLEVVRLAAAVALAAWATRGTAWALPAIAAAAVGALALGVWLRRVSSAAPGTPPAAVAAPASAD